MAIFYKKERMCTTANTTIVDLHEFSISAEIAENLDSIVQHSLSKLHKKCCCLRADEVHKRSRLNHCMD